MTAEPVLECDVAVIGGGLGGVAAALRACRAGCRVCLAEESPWVGGASRGLCALDEHEHIESFGGTASYGEFRQGLRDRYRDRLGPALGATTTSPLNPGGGWSSRLCFEPIEGLIVLLGLLRPHVAAGRLEILYGARPVAVDRHGDRLRAVVVECGGGRRVAIRAAFILDATELGDLLPLARVPHITGAESREQTGEPNARPDGPAPHLTQAAAMPFAVDLRPGGSHAIPRPPDYERWRDGQPYNLALRHGPLELTHKLFEAAADRPGPLWTYRRILAYPFAPAGVEGDLAMIQWAGNDFKDGDLVGASPAGRREMVSRAKAVSLGFLHWLQTEAPRDDGTGRGYPELRLRTDVLGTADGLSMAPCVRESRRLLACTTVREQDVAAAYRAGPRAAPFADSVGLGWHPIVIHGRPGDMAGGGPTKPFQIPLGALIPRDGPANLLAACRNLGATHITNGCYSVHPVEWNVGEAAGALAAFCLGEGAAPAAVHQEPGRLRRFQAQLLSAGVPLYWFTDVPQGHPAFGAVQKLAAWGVWPPDGDDLRFEPDRPFEADLVDRLRAAVGPAAAGWVPGPCSRAEAAIAVAGFLPT